jgi:hypothetical protein
MVRKRYRLYTISVVNMYMRYRDLIEAATPRVSTGILQQAAYDFLNDWAQIDPEDEHHEPSPRRDFMAAVRHQGLDPATNPEQVTAALITLMRTEAQRFLSAMPWHNGKLTVYRNIRAPEGWERDPGQHGDLGVFWALTEIWHGNITMVSEVTARQVAWEMVILKHLTYSENEIRLKDNAKVPIVRVYYWNDGQATERDVSHLAGKLFSVGERSDDWPD